MKLTEREAAGLAAEARKVRVDEAREAYMESALVGAALLAVPAGLVFSFAAWQATGSLWSGLGCFGSSTSIVYCAAALSARAIGNKVRPWEGVP